MQRTQKTDEQSLITFRTALSRQISLSYACINMCMQLIYSESFMTMTQACKVSQEELDMGSKLPATFLSTQSAHLCRCRICMPRHVVRHGDQSGSKVSQLYFWTLAMHVSHLPGVMLLHHQWYRIVCCTEQIQAGGICISWIDHCQGRMHYVDALIIVKL